PRDGAQPGGIVLAEMANSKILWTEPRDLDVANTTFELNDFSKDSIRSHDKDGPIVVFENLSKARLNAKETNDASGLLKRLVTGAIDAAEAQRLEAQGTFSYRSDRPK